MPRYDYVCDDCGPFQAWAAMDDADKDCTCSACGQMGLRQVAMPRLGLMNGKLRRALDRSERSSDQPRVMKRKHLDSCGCSLCGAKRKPPAVSRRWMIGH